MRLGHTDYAAGETRVPARSPGSAGLGRHARRDLPSLAPSRARWVYRGRRLLRHLWIPHHVASCARALGDEWDQASGLLRTSNSTASSRGVLRTRRCVDRLLRSRAHGRLVHHSARRVGQCPVLRELGLGRVQRRLLRCGRCSLPRLALLVAGSRGAVLSVVALDPATRVDSPPPFRGLRHIDRRIHHVLRLLNLGFDRFSVLCVLRDASPRLGVRCGRPSSTLPARPLGSRRPLGCTCELGRLGGNSVERLPIHCRKPISRMDRVAPGCRNSCRHRCRRSAGTLVAVCRCIMEARAIHGRRVVLALPLALSADHPANSGA